MYQRLVCLLNSGCNATDFRGYETQPGIFFPPPPPSVQTSSGSSFSPALAGIIVLLAFAFIAVSYYTIFVKSCTFRESPGQRRRRLASRNGVFPTDAAVPMLAHGLDEAVIKAIPVCKYIRGDGLVEITDCSVCLSEFQENDSLRLLPKCSHAFHLPCIDVWLQSHSTCPLCRANVISTVPGVPEPATSPPVLDPILQNLSLLEQENHVHDLQALAENNLPGTSEEHKEENLVFDEEGPLLLKREDRVASNRLDGQSYTRSLSIGCASSKRRKQLFLSLKRSFSLRSSSRNVVVDFVTELECIQDTPTNCRSERQTESSIEEPGCACEDLEKCSFPVLMEIPLVDSSSTQMRKGNLKSKSFHDSINLRSKAYDLSRGKVLSLKRSFSAGRMFSFISSGGRTAIRADINRTPILNENLIRRILRNSLLRVSRKHFESRL